MASLLSPTINIPQNIEQSSDALELAARTVDQSVLKDRSFSDLANVLQVQSHNQPAVSGWLDADYPGFSDTKMRLATHGQIDEVHRAALPSELLEQFAHMQSNSMMGVFPEIGRAWLTVDSDVFVWNYHDGSDLAYFDGLSETIFGIGLVKPKPGVFKPHIEWLLCLTTPADIVLLGVSFSSRGTGRREMHLLPDPLFCLPTEGVRMVEIVGTRLGRIFLAGQDSCLYEVTYQATDGWFSRKCRKINHSTSRLSFMMPSFLNMAFADDDSVAHITIDESRNILYALTEKQTIQVYYLGSDGQGLRKVAAMSSYTIVQAATAISRSIDKSHFTSVVAIAPVTLAESEYIHLLAVTSTGMRLYFSTSRFDLGTGAGVRSQPSQLVMVHVRLPPGFSMNTSQQQPRNIHSASYKDGTLIMSGKETEDRELLWVVSCDTFPFHKALCETVEVVPVEGRVWALAEVKGIDEMWSTQVPTGLEPPAVVKQHLLWKRHFVLVNSLGTCVVTKNLPVGQLRFLLEREGPESPKVAAFFEVLGEQACECSIQLACSQRAVEANLAEMAAVAFFRHGGNTETNVNASSPVSHGQSFLGVSAVQSPVSVFKPGQVSTPIANNVTQHLSFTGIDNSVLGPQSNPQQGNLSPMHQFSFSPRHNGLCLYLGRLLRLLWDARLAATYEVPKELLYSTVSFTELTEVSEKLGGLQAFMRKYSQFISPLVAESYSADYKERTVPGFANQQLQQKQQMNDSQESASLRQVELLIGRCCEVLGLWKVLCEHQLHVIGKHLTVEEQAVVQAQTLRSLATSGREVITTLITTLISLYIDDNAATDAISERLREICPSLYSQEDAVFTKANEKLLTCGVIPSEREKERQLSDALALYKQISTQLNMAHVTSDFRSARHFNAIVDLSLTAASKKDIQGLALHYYKNSEPVDDIQGKTAFEQRRECYTCILDTLEYLLEISQSHPQAPSIPTAPGPPPPKDPNRLSNVEAEKYAEDMFALALKSDDELFHVALYDWLVCKNMPEKLLDIQSPYLEEYLKKRATSQPDQLPVVDLLWKFYEKNNNYFAASRILAKLAEQSVIPLDLASRIEYLSRATMCAKSSTTVGQGGSDGEFLHQLEEKMDVARLQMGILDTIAAAQDIPSRDKNEAVQRLNTQLLDISTLYSEFAQEYDLPECSLAILHCAGHQEPTLVQTLWQEIITKELRACQKEGRNIMMNCIQQKMVSLGKLYTSSERYFPLAFLIRYLELKSCELQFSERSPGFVLNLLHEVGVAMPRLLDFYDRLHKSKDPCWAALHQPLHLLKAIVHLLQAFVENPHQVASYERRRFTLTCQDLISGYMVELQSGSLLASGGAADPRALIAEFRAIQAKLERLAD